MKLTAKQRAVLRQGSVEGVTIGYVLHWVGDGGEQVTRQVRALQSLGLMRATYDRHGKASANVTDAGRKVLEGV